MTAPSIEMIAESLRVCTIGRRRRGSSRRRPAPPEVPTTVTVELNSDVALPYRWEQCLDLQTGDLYYINWMTDEKTSEDPRKPSTFRRRDSPAPPPKSSCYSRTFKEISGGDVDDDSDAESCCSSTSSSGLTSLSSPSSGESSTNAPPRRSGAGEVLVAAGCKSCFMYFMVPKQLDSCPKCGGLLLHLGRDS